MDLDPAVVEQNYKTVRRAGEKNILPLLLDLTNPSPQMGWNSCERDSFIARSKGDLALALALLHHLAISNNLPLVWLADFFAAQSRWLIIEFIPKSDSQDQRLLASRRDIFPEYSREGFETPGYYQLAYDLFVPAGGAALILAEHEGDPLAGIMVFAQGKTAWYFYGASSDVKRNLMPTYGVQWAAIQWAKARGCDYYDLWGIPDEDEATLEAQFQDREDGLWGVYGFKRGWGGQVVRSAGAWDKVYNHILYRAYRLVLKSREARDES